MIFYCTVFSQEVWWLCFCRLAAKSDGVARLVWEFQRNITGMVSCLKKKKKIKQLINKIIVFPIATMPETSNTARVGKKTKQSNYL